MQVHTKSTIVLRGVGLAAALAMTVAACGDSGTKATTPATTTAATAQTTVPAVVTTAAAPTTAAPATTAASAAPTTVAAPAAGAALTLKVATTSLGSVLVDGAGRTLYVFTKDEKNKSNCAGGCLSTWPPLVGTAKAGPGVDAAKLGTIATADGKTQVTMDGQPLYYYAPDTAAGDAKGQKVGGVWFVVDGAGVVNKG